MLNLMYLLASLKCKEGHKQLKTAVLSALRAIVRAALAIQDRRHVSIGTLTAQATFHSNRTNLSSK